MKNIFTGFTRNNFLSTWHIISTDGVYFWKFIKFEDRTLPSHAKDNSSTVVLQVDGWVYAMRSTHGLSQRALR